MHHCSYFQTAFLAFALCSPLLAADEAAKTAAPEAASESKEQDFKGEVAGKGLAAKPGVAAIMKVPKGEKDVEWVDLLADGDLAKKLDEIGEKHAEVTVTGVRTPAGIKVTKVGDDLKMPPDKKKKKK
jgi:hypothetical protein